MDWKNDTRRRYAAQGSDAFHEAQQTFRDRIESFCAVRGIIINDDNPEGKDWLVLLKDGTELYVERRSYDTGNTQTDFWIEYCAEYGGIVAEFFDSSARPSTREVLIPNSDIASVNDEWR